MRRRRRDDNMRRRLLNLLTLLSLLLCVAVCVLWVRSRSRYDVLLYGGGGGRLVKVCSDHRGVKVVTLQHWPHAEPVRWLHGESGTAGHNAATGWQYRGGSLWEREVPLLGVSAAGWLTVNEEAAGKPFSLANDVPAHSVRVPHGLLALGLAAPIAPIGILRARSSARRRRRATQRLCPMCGYDLRATPGRCPECGAAGPGPEVPS